MRTKEQCNNILSDLHTGGIAMVSKTKTQCVYFCNLRKPHGEPVLYSYNTPVNVIDQVKFLGIFFSSNVYTHSTYLLSKCKCMKTLNLLNVLSHTDWGIDRIILLHFYPSLIRFHRTMEQLFTTLLDICFFKY